MHVRKLDLAGTRAGETSRTLRCQSAAPYAQRLGISYRLQMLRASRRPAPAETAPPLRSGHAAPRIAAQRASRRGRTGTHAMRSVARAPQPHLERLVLAARQQREAAAREGQAGDGAAARVRALGQLRAAGAHISASRSGTRVDGSSRGTARLPRAGCGCGRAERSGQGVQTRPSTAASNHNLRMLIGLSGTEGQNSDNTPPAFGRR